MDVHVSVHWVRWNLQHQNSEMLQWLTSVQNSLWGIYLRVRDTVGAWFSRQLQPLVATALLHSPHWKQCSMKPEILANTAKAERPTTHVDVNLHVYEGCHPTIFLVRNLTLSKWSSSTIYGHCVQWPPLVITEACSLSFQCSWKKWKLAAHAGEKWPCLNFLA